MSEQDKVFYHYNGNNLTVEDWDSRREVSFEDLVQAVKVTHSVTQAGAIKAINRMQTMRNWIVGYYIVEFEQKGKDRAEYGDRLLKRLSERVTIKGLTDDILSSCRIFYREYPQMKRLFGTSPGTVSQILDSVNPKFESSPESIITKLSYSHLRVLFPIEDPVIRYFYEQQCMRETWSVRELRRQITSNLHIRVGLSRVQEKCLALAGGEENSTQLQVRDPYTLEFLGLKAKDVVTESNLEDALISHLQEFLLECGSEQYFIKENVHTCSAFNSCTILLNMAKIMNNIDISNFGTAFLDSMRSNVLSDSA